MVIFEFENYKEFVRAKVKSMPHNGRGQYLKIAKILGIHTTMVTHIFKGKAHLSAGQTLNLAKYFGLSDLEMDYLVQMVLVAKAENQEAREYFLEKMNSIREKQLNLRDRLNQKKKMEEKDQAEFFSAWYYVGIWLATALPDGKTPEEIANFYSLQLGLVTQVLRFLSNMGKVTEQNGKYFANMDSVFVGKESPFLYRHHINWRLKCMEKYYSLEKEDLVFTNPISLSKKILI